MRSSRLIVAVTTAAALLGVLAASPALGAETKGLTGYKMCAPPYVSISPPNPGGYCLITKSSLKILRGAKVYYTAAVIDSTAGTLTSPVTLRATDRRGSTATGHCTYYFLAGHGLCVYTGGTGKLAGFNASLVVGPPTPGYSLTGTYWFAEDDDD